MVQQIQRIGKQPELLALTLGKMRQQNEKERADLAAEEKAIQRELARHCAAMGKVKPDEDSSELVARIGNAERRLAELRQKLEVLQGEVVDEELVKEALAAFEPVWEQMSPREQARVIKLLVESISYDGREGSVSIAFRQTGLKAFSEQQEMAA